MCTWYYLSKVIFLKFTSCFKTYPHDFVCHTVQEGYVKLSTAPFFLDFLSAKNLNKGIIWLLKENISVYQMDRSRSWFYNRKTQVDCTKLRATAFWLSSFNWERGRKKNKKNYFPTLFPCSNSSSNTDCYCLNIIPPTTSHSLFLLFHYPLVATAGVLLVAAATTSTTAAVYKSRLYIGCGYRFW